VKDSQGPIDTEAPHGNALLGEAFTLRCLINGSYHTQQFTIIGLVLSRLPCRQ
jgi:hypothetical protein